MVFQLCERSYGVSFWQNKRVLITGADGFLGSNLTKDLLSSGAKVTTLSRRGIGRRSLLTLEDLSKKIAHQEIGSVENFKRLDELIRSHSIEVIYHLAALPLVEVGRDNPVKTFEVNIRGTWNILEAARQNEVSKIVAVSTTHVYGDNPHLPYREAFYPQPSRPYETSKACADLLAQCYADTYGLGVEIPRFVNIYGPGDSNVTRIVPKTIQSVLSGKKPTIWNNGAVRDFLYIDDAVRALTILVEKDLHLKKRNRIFNFGSGKPIAIDELVKTIVKVANLDESITEVQAMPRTREKEIQKQYVSIAKAKKELGWQPETTLTEGLKKTIAWYQTHEVK